jgi:hypothetical protein
MTILVVGRRGQTQDTTCHVIGSDILIRLVCWIDNSVPAITKSMRLKVVDRVTCDPSFESTSAVCTTVREEGGPFCADSATVGYVG